MSPIEKLVEVHGATTVGGEVIARINDINVSLGRYVDGLCVLNTLGQDLVDAMDQAAFAEVITEARARDDAPAPKPRGRSAKAMTDPFAPPEPPTPAEPEPDIDALMAGADELLES